MSDTPRTDAQMRYPALGEIWTIDINFARTLERELTEAKAELRQSEREVEQMATIGEALTADPEELKALVQHLTDAHVNLKDRYDREGIEPDPYYEARQKAVEFWRAKFPDSHLPLV